MQKDLKIGLISGLVVVSIAVLWLATRPSLSPQARVLDAHSPGGKSSYGPGAVDSRQEGTNASAQVGRTRTSETTVRSSQPPRTTYSQPERVHVVRDGETLSQISFDYYGSAGKWRRIFDANRKIIKDANVVMPGTKLVIPN